MKKVLLICALSAGLLPCAAQTTIDHFNVGPYVVDYNGKGNVRYRLSDNVDLYEYFELSKDTVVVEKYVTPKPVDKHFEIGVKFGAGSASLSYGIEAKYRTNIGKKGAYFAPGISAGMVSRYSDPKDWGALEIGVPIVFGYSTINRQHATLYAEIGIAPTFYSLNKTPDSYTDKKSGFLVVPTGGVGFNIPSERIIWKIGFWTDMKLNCSSGDIKVYKDWLGSGAVGVKIGMIF